MLSVLIDGYVLKELRVISLERNVRCLVFALDRISSNSRDWLQGHNVTDSSVIHM